MQLHFHPPFLAQSVPLKYVQLEMGVSVCVLVALTQLLASATTEHVVYSGKTQEGGGEGVCPGDQQTRTVLDEMDMEVRGVVRNTILPNLGPVGSQQYNPANSCSEISELYPRQSSGYYGVRSHTGTAVQVYCDMDRVCGCNSTGGFTRVANLNMRNPSEQCPGEWILQTYSSEPRRLCGRGSSGAGCLSAVYNSYGISYSHVCGRVIGYQYASTDGFGYMQNIEGPYVDGVSLTHGEPGARVHIWTFVADYRSVCANAPSFIRNDYFCDRGVCLLGEQRSLGANCEFRILS